MKKIISLIVLGHICLHSYAQKVKAVVNKNKVGAEFISNPGQADFTIPAIYDDLQMMVYSEVGNWILGKGYLSCKLWMDSTFYEVPTDPNNPAITRIDTVVNLTRRYLPDYAIVVRDAQKGWGLINRQAEPIEPLKHTYFKTYYPFAWNGIDTTQSPYLLFYDNHEFNLYSGHGKRVLTSQKIKAKELNEELMSEVLDLSYFGNYLVIPQGGEWKQVATKNKDVKTGKPNLCTVYVGGGFQVLNLSNGKALFDKPMKNLSIQFYDDAGAAVVDAVNLRDAESVYTFLRSSDKSGKASIFDFRGRE